VSRMTETNNRPVSVSLCSRCFGFEATSPAWASGDQGHEIVPVIAADNLSPATREHVAKVLGPSEDVQSLEEAMAAASIRPDTEFREEDRSTAPWHFIDICLQDSRSDVPAGYPGGACLTAKIDEFTERLKNGRCDRWGGAGASRIGRNQNCAQLREFPCRFPDFLVGRRTYSVRKVALPIPASATIGRASDTRTIRRV
jgi:S1/P1 Nuclease